MNKEWCNHVNDYLIYEKWQTFVEINFILLSILDIKVIILFKYC